ncbi:TPA: hypothetical protein ACUIW2_002234 [Klebsiella pneumoniae]
MLQRLDKTPEDDESEEDNLVPEVQGKITAGGTSLKRLVRIDQKPIGRTPRSNLATYTGFFDTVRKLFADTNEAKKRNFDASRCPARFISSTARPAGDGSTPYLQ